MNTLYYQVCQLLGFPPADCEWIAYLTAAVLLIIFALMCFRIIASICKIGRY